MNLKPHHRVSSMVLIAAASYSLHHTGYAEESAPAQVKSKAATQQPMKGELTFFDYLGTLVQEDEQFVDPVDVFGTNRPLNEIDKDLAEATATPSATKDSSEAKP